MRANSLALRLFLSATTWTVVILVITGFVLSSFYRTTVERSFDRRLAIHLTTLVADLTEPDGGGLESLQPAGEPAFNIPFSGWYWQVTRLDTPDHQTKSSQSLWDRGLPDIAEGALENATDNSRTGYVAGPQDQRLRMLERIIDAGAAGRYRIAVAGDSAEIEEEVDGFNRALIITFAILASVLVLTAVFQVRFGLAPLQRISRGLAAIRSGRAERLEGSFPVEIAPLARETNALIEANREIVERARMHVGNLAHALKTPLSVMMNEATTHAGDPLADKVREQTEIMRDQVTHHLERARLAARASVVATVTDVGTVADALARTMEKIHGERDIVLNVAKADGARFRGEQQDLEEMVGNLVDNAFKWAQSRVAVEVYTAQPDADDSLSTVHVIVDDDGPGLSPAERETVARRGQRLDETKPGSGLGLSIVTELASLYGGALHLGTAPIGGLRAELVLPAV